MEDNYISFYTSKLLYELDKDAFVTPKHYNENGKSYTVSLVVRRLTQNNNIYYPRIKQSVLHKWLRERHNIHVIPYIMTAIDSKNYSVECVIPKLDGCIGCDKIYSSNEEFRIYEDALEIGMRESIKYLLNINKAKIEFIKNLKNDDK